jgi:hypothetical protein
MADFEVHSEPFLHLADIGEEHAFIAWGGVYSGAATRPTASGASWTMRSSPRSRVAGVRARSERAGALRSGGGRGRARRPDCLSRTDERARCARCSHTFICDGVTIGDEVFVGHRVTFTRDKRPRVTNGEGTLQTDADWELAPIVVENAGSIGSAP